MALRILHVTPYCEAAWGYGGIPRVVGAVTRELARRGHRVTIVTTDARDAVRRLRPGEETVDGIETRVFPNVSNALAYQAQLFLPRGLGSALARASREVDVAQLHALRNLPVALASRALAHAGVPWVAAPNGTAPRIERRRLAKSFFDAVVDRLTLPRAARVLAVSQAERAQLRMMGVDDARIRDVPNPVELDRFAKIPSRGAFRSRHGLGDAPVVAYFGKLTPRKRVDVLIEAFAKMRLPGARLVIAGNDMGSERSLRRLAAMRGVDALFTGLVEDRGRLEALVDADVLVYPGEDEIFGLVALESLLCGTPVLVAGGSGCGEIVTGVGLSDWVTPSGDSGALAAAIMSVLDGRDAARERAAGTARLVRERYSPAAVVDALEAVYREVARA